MVVLFTRFDMAFRVSILGRYEEMILYTVSV